MLFLIFPMDCFTTMSYIFIIILKSEIIRAFPLVIIIIWIYHSLTGAFLIFFRSIYNSYLQLFLRCYYINITLRHYYYIVTRWCHCDVTAMMSLGLKCINLCTKIPLPNEHKFELRIFFVFPHLIHWILIGDKYMNTYSISMHRQQVINERLVATMGGGQDFDPQRFLEIQWSQYSNEYLNFIEWQLFIIIY